MSTLTRNIEVGTNGDHTRDIQFRAKVADLPKIKNALPKVKGITYSKE